MRHGLTQAIHHARHRAAFGKSLDEQGLMLRVLADLALESEAATSAALRLAGAYDRVARGAEPPATPASPPRSPSTGSASATRALGRGARVPGG